MGSGIFSLVRWLIFIGFKKLTGRRPFVCVCVLSHIQSFATPWPAACQASLPFTAFQSLLRFMSVELTVPSNHLILCCPFPFCPQFFPGSGSLPGCRLFTSGRQSIGASTSASVLSVNIQCWFPLGWTGLIFFLSKRLSRVFSSATVWKHQFFSAQPSLWPSSHICPWL